MKTYALAAVTVLAAAGCLVAVPTAASATPPACGDASLVVSASRTQGFAGHGALVLRFRNKTMRACTLFGYPGLDALNRRGGVIAHARRTLSGAAGGSPTGLHTVRVNPGGFASATVEWLNFDPVTAGACRFSHAIAATPPNTGHTVVLDRSVSVCRLQVHPTVAGRTGRS